MSVSVRTPCSPHWRSTTWNLTRIPLVRPSIIPKRCVGLLQKLLGSHWLFYYRWMLTYYELDPGLNHVIRKRSELTDPRANLLVQVLGGQVASSDRFDGPSSDLVCCEDHIIYCHVDCSQHRGPIPCRKHPWKIPHEVSP